MAKHEFGIMQTDPESGKRYDEYEPEKYNCISVDDEYIEKIADEISSIDFYWHTLDIPAKGIAYCGITLIPPESIESVITVIKNCSELAQLKAMLEKAAAENKWVIHFGL